MGFGTLAIIAAAGLIGPLLALRSGWNIPVVLGELVAGLVLGSTGFGWLDAADPTFAFLADIGFALVMFVAGSHVPVRDPRAAPWSPAGLLRAIAVGVIAAVLGVRLSTVFDTGNGALYAVLMASSSAALILPIVDSLGMTGPAVLRTVAAGRDRRRRLHRGAAVGHRPGERRPGRARGGGGDRFAVLTYFMLRWFERSGLRRRVHRISEQRKFAVELRISLTVLFSLAAVAVGAHVSIMLAGFAFGLVVAAIGEPRRLARQLFALTEGFLGPLFFVWLGASLNVRELAAQPSLVLLGLLLGVGALFAHAAMRVTGQPLAIGSLACAQLGVPVAAATLATQLHLLGPGEASALILGALITVVVTVVAAGVAARGAAAGDAAPAVSPTDEPPPATSPAG